MKTDYLIIGSGLAALSFGSLMAKAGKKVVLLEAHYSPGGYAHTFKEGNYKFNAQLHYVWNCGKGQSIHRILTKLDLGDAVRFNELDPLGYDHMRTPEYVLNIPYDQQLLIDRLLTLIPGATKSIREFFTILNHTAGDLENLPKTLSFSTLIPRLHQLRHLWAYRKATLQNLFDHCQLPLPAQTLLALQWPDFMLPPRDLSFLAWVSLFTGYCRGAYYPEKHFEHVIDSLVKIIVEHGGEVIYNRHVIGFHCADRVIKSVITEATPNAGNDIGYPRTTIPTSDIMEYSAAEIICNMDPRRAAEMIGLERFSPAVRNHLNYDYSPSNFMAYCVVEGIDLQRHGFGRWNLFHSELPDINLSFDDMYLKGDYRHPSFAVTAPGLLTDNRSDCPEGQQILEFITVADYHRFLELKIADPWKYQEKKNEVFNAMIAVMERYYIPNLRKHLVFTMTGSPTTNEWFCRSPCGNSYGSNLTPRNLSFNRLTHETSFSNFYFCNASSGFPGFSGALTTGCRLYEYLSGDSVL